MPRGPYGQPVGLGVPTDLGPAAKLYVDAAGVQATPGVNPSDFVGGSMAVFPPDAFGGQAFMPPSPTVKSLAFQAGIPYVPPPDPYGGEAFGTYFAPNVKIAGMNAGIPFVPPPDPFGGKAFGNYRPNPTPPPVTAFAAGIPFIFPPEPFGGEAFFTPPLIPTIIKALQQGSGPIFPPDPFGGFAFFTPNPGKIFARQSGNGPIFPPDPFGAQAFLVIPRIPSSSTLGMSAGSRAVFPPDPFGGFSVTPMTPFVPPQVLRSMMTFGSRAVFPDDPYGGVGFTVIPRLPTRNYAAKQMGSGFMGEYEYGFSIAFNPHGSFFFVAPTEGTGGGGEWVIWQPPDFPGNRPGFRRPTRTEKRGY